MEILDDRDTFVKVMGRMVGYSDPNEYADHLAGVFGSVEKAMEVKREHWLEIEEEDRIKVTSGNVITIGRKPISGEEVGIVKMNDNVSFRFWGGGLEFMKSYCFAFVQTRDPSRYMPTPKDIKVTLLDSMGSAGEVEIHSIGSSLKEGARGSVRYVSKALHPNGIDKNDETYVIPESSHLRI